MQRIGLVLVCCALLGACTVVDVGVGRGSNDWNWEMGADCYGDIAWPANDLLLSMDIWGGPTPGTLISADVWRLLHLEVGLLGLGLGIGPLQFGAGVGPYVPSTPASIAGMNPFEG